MRKDSVLADIPKKTQLAFKKIELCDLSLISEYLQAQTYRICDFTQLGIYMWVDYFGYEYAIADNTLFLRENGKNGDAPVRYLLPIGQTKPLSEHISFLYHQTGADENFPLRLCAVPEEAKEELLTYFQASCTLSRDWSDYLYDRDELATLSGKKFSKKRNLIHQFDATYTYEFRVVEPKDIGCILAFLEAEGKDESLSELARYEIEKTKMVLCHYNSFDLIGYVLFVEGALAAFSIGECKNDTYFVHIEKADRKIKGVYQMINCLSVTEAMKTKSFSLVNREEDVGDEGLRQTKESYHPCKMANKYEMEIFRLSL